MRTKPKNGLNKPNDVIVFDIPEASVTDRGRAKKLRYLKRAKGVTHVGSVPSYCNDYRDYIYVKDLGERIKPAHLTQVFPEFLEKHGMRRIRFHDLRHSCASLLYANCVALKDIQERLGHSDIATTSNIYTHLDFSSKVASAEAIMPFYPK